MEEMSYVFLFTFFFHSAAHFHFGGASISHFLTSAKRKNSCFPSERNWSPLIFISRSNSFSVIVVNEDIDDKFSGKKHSALLLFNFSL